MVSLALTSCVEEEVIQEDEKPNEVTLDETVSGPANIGFSIEGEIGFETNTDISFTNESQNLAEVSWEFGDGAVSSEQQSVTHSYADAGKYTVTIHGITSDGEVLSHSKTIFVRKNGAELGLLFISFLDSTLNYVDLNTEAKTTLYKVPHNPAGVLALNENENKVYYYDYSDSTIYENDLYTNNPVPLLLDVPGVSDLEFDEATGDLLIALPYANLIFRYNPSTPTLEPVYSSVRSGKFGRVRDMDLKSGSLYTITPTQSYESVFKVDLTLGDASQLINYEEGGYGYGVAFDDLNQKVYFNNVEQAALMRSEVDGSNIEKVIDLDRSGTVSFAGLCLTGMRVVETRNQLMWSSWEDGKLYILDLETYQEEMIELEGLTGKFVTYENTDF